MVKWALALIVLVVVGLGSTVVYAYMRPPAAASGPIRAIPVAQEAAGPAPAPLVAQSTASVENPPATSTALIVFEIDQSSSQARFVISEVLRGSPKTVVGTTNQVAGQIVIRPDERTAQVGTVLINARALTTDDEQRNRAIRNRILLTDRHEYVSFTPTALRGLPDTAKVGETYSFQMVGGLDIVGVTRDVEFAVAVTPTSETRLEGKATATIKYADWGIVIPQVPFVAGVSDEVRLELDFVALAK